LPYGIVLNQEFWSFEFGGYSYTSAAKSACSSL